MRRLQNAFKTGNRKGDFLRTAINMTVNGGKQKISNLGEALAYYKPLLDKIQGGWDQFEKVQDAAGNEIYKLKGSENAKGQPLYIWFKMESSCLQRRSIFCEKGSDYLKSLVRYEITNQS